LRANFPELNSSLFTFVSPTSDSPTNYYIFVNGKRRGRAGIGIKGRKSQNLPWRSYIPTAKMQHDNRNYEATNTPEIELQFSLNNVGNACLISDETKRKFVSELFKLDGEEQF